MRSLEELARIRREVGERRAFALKVGLAVLPLVRCWLETRAQTAGVVGFHPHKLRHTAAHRWLARGGSEGGLMAVAGWTRPDMLLRYTRAQASSRAAEEAQRLNLGEL